jgi:2,4-dienoyl-CoA reductase-like NADH-dependent reductase (Old Yellow Enzyme family)
MTNSLASPLTLPCGVSIPNRLGKSAMTEGLADANDNPSEALIKLYRSWSDGGSGLLMTGNVMIDRRYLERAGNVVLEDDQAMPMLRRWAAEGTHGGNQLWMQISHPGRQCPRMVNSQPLAPSEVQLKLLANFSKPRMMTEADIEDVIQRFTRSASLAKQAGFTGVQIHCAHGYLISQFLSPLINHRDDQWGGSLENRARLARRIIRSVREAVGSEFPVSAKLNSADFQKGGFSFDECITVAKWLAEDGLDLLEISGGTYEQASMLDLDTAEVRESTRQREAYFLEYANKIHESAKIPLMITGGFRNRDVMENAVNSGEVDLVGFARPLCTQPDAPKQLINQSIDTVDLYENGLVLGRGFWGNNSSSSMVKSINAFGQLGFYYWQIIRLSEGLPVEPGLGVLKAFSRHMLNDFRLNQRRKKAAKAGEIRSE